jgi:hypothetical protein
MRTAGEVVDAFIQCRTKVDVEDFLDAYLKICSLPVAVSNLRFGVTRFYADTTDRNDPRAIHAKELMAWLGEIVVDRVARQAGVGV